MLFPMSITVTVNTPEQLQAFMAASVCAKPSPALGAAEATNKQEATKPAPKPEAAAANAAPPAATAASTTTAPTAAASGGDATIDKAKDLTMKIVAAKGRDEAVKLLQKYGVPVAAKLPADQVGAFCTDAEAVLVS